MIKGNNPLRFDLEPNAGELSAQQFSNPYADRWEHFAEEMAETTAEEIYTQFEEVNVVGDEIAEGIVEDANSLCDIEVVNEDESEGETNSNEYTY